MADPITYCRDCANLSEANAKQHWSRWQCVRFPRISNAGFMAREYEDEPHMRCKDINGGFCPLFTPIRDQEQVSSDRVHRSDFEQTKQANS